MPKQQVGLFGAVAIGLASMLGAGVFVVFGNAYQIAGDQLFLALSLAALVAILNSASIYQLAKQVDRPGGVYAYARVYRNKMLSFIAGFSFTIGKIGSIAAIAISLAGYLVPEYKKLGAILIVLVMVVINSLGIQRTAAVAAVLAVSTTTFLAFTSGVGFLNVSNAANLSATLEHLPNQNFAAAASLMFFAFAGYARVATLGDEVRQAKRNIPRAIVLTLSAVLVLYFSLCYLLVAFLGENLIGNQAPFLDLFHSIYANAGASVVFQSILKVLIIAASLGSMLALLAGVGRTASTMAEDSEIPKIFEHRNRFGAPWLAELIIAIGASALVLVGNITEVIGFSSFSVLLYYAIGHLSAISQPRHERSFSRVVSWLGLILCIWLSLSAPGNAPLVSLAIIAVVLVVRRLVRR